MNYTYYINNVEKLTENSIFPYITTSFGADYYPQPTKKTTEIGSNEDLALPEPTFKENFGLNPIVYNKLKTFTANNVDDLIRRRHRIRSEFDNNVNWNYHRLFNRKPREIVSNLELPVALIPGSKEMPTQNPMRTFISTSIKPSSLFDEALNGKKEIEIKSDIKFVK